MYDAKAQYASHGQRRIGVLRDRNHRGRSVQGAEEVGNAERDLTITPMAITALATRGRAAQVSLHQPGFSLQAGPPLYGPPVVVAPPPAVAYGPPVYYRPYYYGGHGHWKHWDKHWKKHHGWHHKHHGDWD